MTLGLTGNPEKDAIWRPVADLVAHLRTVGVGFCLDVRLADGLLARGLAAFDDACICPETELGHRAGVVLSFGGDGTLLRTAHLLGSAGTPILGVNIGRLGFLADIETQELHEAVDHLVAGHYRIEARTVLEAHADLPLGRAWALNEFAVERAGRAGLLAVRVHADGVPLNTFWGDGLLVATPTGSTAYSLSVGGPLISPEAAVVVLAPVAPHSLTVRPIVLADTVLLELEVRARGDRYVVAADGESTFFEQDTRLTIKRGAHPVRLVKLPGQHFFATLREKLMWGADVKAF
ncbi:MAG TPA: NAD(+)/NADH kinase [Rhodothermales bacterium]|nr:NAD(+)/NADH kinase [Rhodothermales bacterium]